MYERLFVCEDCKVSYTMTYETEQGMKNARRTRCPKCQRVHELNRKRKNRSQNVFQEPKTDNSTLELSKNALRSEFSEEIPAFIPQSEPESLNSRPDPAEEPSASSFDPEPAIKEGSKWQTERSEVPGQAYKVAKSPTLLSSFGKRIQIYGIRQDEKDTLRNAIAYGRHYRKDLD